MSDEPDEVSGDADTPGARGADRPDGSRDRSGLLAGEAAAIARFGEGRALFSADVPTPRHPHVGPLLPRRRIAFPPAGTAAAGGHPGPAPSTELVRARRDLPARRVDPAVSAWTRAGIAARRGVEVVVDLTARGVVAAVDVVGAAAQAVVTLVFGPERVATPREHTVS
ncbi:MAG TPA: hypothetical protein VGH76_12250 [Actinomycetospora sp.]|jgi:hypothetical protein|uniref:hypothetical protein n=1 Tax=Actinomycetospora sp. TaxID=1872135 RepID=UPI002F3F412F